MKRQPYTATFLIVTIILDLLLAFHQVRQYPADEIYWLAFATGSAALICLFLERKPSKRERKERLDRGVNSLIQQFGQAGKAAAEIVKNEDEEDE